MIPKLTRLMGALGVVVMAGGLLAGGTLLAADEPDQDNRRPPQTLPQGFESTDRLQRDLERAERAPLYSAWLVESSRFINVPPGSFMPDRAFIPGSTDPKHNIPFFDFPANVGIIKRRTATSPCTTAAGSSWSTFSTGTPRAAGGTSPTR